VLSFQARYGEFQDMNKRVSDIEKQNEEMKNTLASNEELLKKLSLKLDENAKQVSKNISTLESKIKWISKRV